MNLDVSKWKEFRVGDLFSIHPTKAIDGVSADDCVGYGNPLIVNSAENNGVAGLCDIEPTEDGNIITFSDTTDGNTFFYQPNPFIGFAHVQGMYPKNHNINKNVMLFISTILMFDSRGRYSYGRKMRRDTISEIMLKLPVDSDSNPDWQFMENYIESLHHKQLTTKNKPGQAPNLNVSEWKEFVLTDVFRLKGGFYNKKPEHSTDGNIPFLASTESNNGVTEYYSLEDIKQWDKVGGEDWTLDNKVYDGNCIAVTVNGSVCNAFYQINRFTCSHDITALYLKKHTLNIYIASFLCTVIMQDKYRWSYGRKPHDVKKFGKSKIKLPIDSDGNPDWKFMEDYIMALPYSDRLEG